jgi:hypothetical protein
MKKIMITAAATIGLVATTIAPTFASSTTTTSTSADKFVLTQKQANFVVYEPVQTYSLKLTNYATQSCGSKGDVMILATYGSKQKTFTIQETSDKTQCTSPIALLQGESQKLFQKPAVKKLSGTILVFNYIGINDSQIATIYKDLAIVK